MKTNNNEALGDYINKIDDVDAEILKKLEERMKLSEQAALCKRERGLPVSNPLEERKKTDKIAEMISENMESYGRLLYNTIVELGKDHERKFTQDDTELVKNIKNARENTPKLFPEKAVVACQGVQGAYSQQAADRLFKRPQIMYMKNFNGVFAAVEQGLCKYGVLPLENSTAGSVNQIYDLMLKHDFYIVRSTRLKVDHSLLVKPGTDRTDIKKIYSHEQAIMQCENYLKQFPDAKVIVCENTAESAKMVSESDRSDVAALASYECGMLYGLDCLEDAVQDSGSNYTRFICISRELEIYPGADKTSLMLTVSHKPGSLYNVLARFYALDINIFKLESRPIPNRDFNFMFYFDVEADVYSEEFIRMMNQTEELSQEFKYLGSYIEIA